MKPWRSSLSSGERHRNRPGGGNPPGSWSSRNGCGNGSRHRTGQQSCRLCHRGGLRWLGCIPQGKGWEGPLARFLPELREYSGFGLGSRKSRRPMVRLRWALLSLLQHSKRQSTRSPIPQWFLPDSMSPVKTNCELLLLNRLASCWFKFSRSWRSFLPASTAMSSYRQTLAPQSTYICRVQSSAWRLPKY